LVSHRALNPINLYACSVVDRSDPILCAIQSLGWQLGVVEEANGDSWTACGLTATCRLSLSIEIAYREDWE